MKILKNLLIPCLALVCLATVSCLQKKIGDYNSLPKNVSNNFDFEKTEQALNNKNKTCGGYSYLRIARQTSRNISLIFISPKDCREIAYLVTIDKTNLKVVDIAEKKVKIE